jgi:protein TonB
MILAYEKSGDWRALSVVAALHAVAIFGLLNVEPVAQAVGLQQPLMVSLRTINQPEPPKEVPKPLPPKPQVQQVKPVQPPPVMAVREEAPSPITVAPPPPEPVPVPVVLPPPTPEPVKSVAVAAASIVAPAQPPPPVIPPRFDADYLDNPAPAYPALSRRVGEHGRVLLRVYVQPDGAAAQVEVRESSGYERLDKAARDTVKRWRFVPAKQGDRGVAAWVLVPISFSIRS